MWHAWHVHKDIKGRAAYLGLHINSSFNLSRDVIVNRTSLRQSAISLFRPILPWTFPTTKSARPIFRSPNIMKSLNHIQHFLFWLNFLVIKCWSHDSSRVFCNTLVERRNGHYKTKAFPFDFQSLEIFLVSKETYYYAWNKRKKN